MPLKKAELITRANKILKTKYPDFKFLLDDYDITAWSNSKKTIVKYRRIIRFTPLNKNDGRLANHLRYDFEVNLTNQRISPFDTLGMTDFYIPTAEEQEKIDFVIDAFSLPRFGFNNSIVEDAKMYRIHIDNDVAFGKYFIDKTTGEECMGSIEGSYAPMPEIPGMTEFPDPLIEISE
ncbi:hypothetical protein F6U93_06725 [Tamlana haliotis]|uniref:Uncharacterized protein n=1 Tax=Pseudotamlana haliotis TaxID=2614804 RepID=A0A6N6MGA2_9FLAO|nr:hypothetical protein [Tamlana haliotis]KAB1068389.1 hypothetical protein F6U93_06725 [Tamlana haliotis]